MAYASKRPPRLRRQARTLPMVGKGDDEGRYYRCWNCGFVCDKERDTLGGPHDSAGLAHSVDPETDTNYRFVAPQAVFTGRQVDFNGDPVVVPRTYHATVTAGCPFCGTKNWRGDYP